MKNQDHSEGKDSDLSIVAACTCNVAHHNIYLLDEALTKYVYLLDEALTQKPLAEEFLKHANTILDSIILGERSPYMRKKAIRAGRDIRESPEDISCPRYLARVHKSLLGIKKNVPNYERKLPKCDSAFIITIMRLASCEEKINAEFFVELGLDYVNQAVFSPKYLNQTIRSLTEFLTRNKEVNKIEDWYLVKDVFRKEIVDKIIRSYNSIVESPQKHKLATNIVLLWSAIVGAYHSCIIMSNNITDIVKKDFEVDVTKNEESIKKIQNDAEKTLLVEHYIRISDTQIQLIEKRLSEAF